MDMFQVIALLLTLAALFSYINYRFIKLPTTIGLMLISLVISLSLIGISHLGGHEETTPAAAPGVGSTNAVAEAEGAREGQGTAGHTGALGLRERTREILQRLDFSKTLMQGMLSFLLFAGALHINLEHLFPQKWIVATLASFGVVISTVIVGGLMFLCLQWLGLGLSLPYCLIFGALISPTDPIAVLALLKQANAPKALDTQIAGESLFNDGVGVVVFLVMYELLGGGDHLEWMHVGHLLLQEAVGGVVLGLGMGWITYQLLKSIDNYQVEVLLTLALVTGGYALASAMHTSGPLAIVAAGLLIGNQGRYLAMSEKTRDNLDTFWELIDESLNAVLFVLIGLEILVLSLSGRYLLAGVMAIPIVLVARFISVSIPVALFRRTSKFSPHVVKILTWGGLRGGISVALALSLPLGPERDLLLAITYAVVVFSILVQGLTIPALLRKALPPPVRSEVAR